MSKNESEPGSKLDMVPVKGKVVSKPRAILRKIMTVVNEKSEVAN